MFCAKTWADNAITKPLLDDLNTALKSKQQSIEEPLSKIMGVSGLPENVYLELQRKSMALLFRFHRTTEMKQLNKEVYLARSKNGQKTYEVYYWVYQSNIAKREDKLLDMLSHAKHALSIAIEKDVKPVFGVAYLTVGDAFFTNEKFLQAIEYLNLAIEFAPNKASKIAYSSRLSDVYQQIGEYSKAIEIQSVAIEELQELGEVARVADAYYSLANSYLLMQNHKQAVAYFIESKNRDTALQNETNVAYSAVKLCESYTALKQFKKANEECHAGRTIFSKYNALANIAWADLALSALYRVTERYQKSESIMQSALEKFSQAMSPTKVSDIHLELAQSQLVLGKLTSASSNVKEAIQLLPAENMAALTQAYLVASQVYESLGQFQTANQYLKKYSELQNKILAASHNKTVSRLQNDIEHIRKQQSIDQLQADKFNQQAELDWHARNIKIGFLVIPATLLLIFWAFRLQMQKNRLLNQEKALLDDIMEKKNQLLADVSHELGTPITVLKLQIEALQDGLEKDVYATYDSLADKLLDIERLISDIHQLAQYDIGADILQIEKVSITDYMQKWRLEAEKLVQHHNLNFSFVSQLPENLEVALDGERFNQVLSNVLSNSIKYTDRPGDIKVGCYLDDTKIEIVFEDSAPSVHSSELAKIFERLYRVDSSRSRQTGGSGLGLAICHSIVNAHQGKIFAEPSSLGGLKVSISVPVKLRREHGKSTCG